jgi:hypothetical protein
MLVGAATPHFALQIRGRVAGYAEVLPAEHRRQAELARYLARLDALAHDGQPGNQGVPDLPPRASLTGAAPASH